MVTPKFRLSMVGIAVLCLTGCDPEKEARTEFQRQGLNPVTPIRDYIDVGGLVLVTKKASVYLDTVYDFKETKDLRGKAVSGIDDPAKSIMAVLRKYDSTGRESEVKGTLKLLETFLPLSITGGLKLTSGVKIEQIDASGTRLKIPEVRALFTSNAGHEVRSYIGDMLVEKTSKIFVIYEIYRAKSLDMSSSSNKEITASVETDKAIDNISKATGSFTMKRPTKTSLKIDGDKYYTFAVRAARLVPKEGGTFALMPGDFKFDKSLGASDTEKFTQPLAAQYGPVSLRKPAEMSQEFQTMYKTAEAKHRQR